MKTAGRVNDDHIAQRVDRIANAFLGDLHRVLAFTAVHAHTDLLAQRLQLIGCSRAVHVARAKKRVMVLLLEQVRELGSSRGFARTLQAHEHNDVGDAA